MSTEETLELDRIPAHGVRFVAGWLRGLVKPKPGIEPHDEMVAAVRHAADLIELVHGLGGSNLEPTLRSTEAWERLADVPADIPLVIALGDAEAPVALLPIVDIDVWTSATGAGPMIRLITGSPQ